MTVISPDLPLSRRIAGPDRRRSGARLRQHRIRPRLSLASESLSRRCRTSSSGCGTRRRCPWTDAGWLQTRVAKRADLAADLLAQAIALRERDPRYRRSAWASRQAARSGARQPVRPSRAMCRQGGARAWRLLMPLDMERARVARRGGARPDRARGGAAVHGGRF